MVLRDTVQVWERVSSHLNKLINYMYLEEQPVLLAFHLLLHFFIQTADLTVVCGCFPACMGENGFNTSRFNNN